MTNDMGYWRDHPNEYWTVEYRGGGCLFAQLADGFGLPRFLRILERIAERFRDGHLVALWMKLRGVLIDAGCAASKAATRVKSN